jgi:hypothetical protein
MWSLSQCNIQIVLTRLAGSGTPRNPDHGHWYLARSADIEIGCAAGQFSGSAVLPGVQLLL